MPVNPGSFLLLCLAALTLAVLVHLAGGRLH